MNLFGCEIRVLRAGTVRAALEEEFAELEVSIVGAKRVNCGVETVVSVVL